ncbi:MAG: hypothetical protein JNL67_09985 [Planctomycetaceae bacterium]|nr:hypothetical protein [Planctomycetaceae bacterium]
MMNQADANIGVTNEDWQRALEIDPWATVVTYYAACLPLHEKARQAAQQRLQLSADQLVEQQVGFADRSLGSLIPHRRTKQGRQLRERLEGLGLYKDNGRETLRGCVTRPRYDANSGHLLGIEAWPVVANGDSAECLWLAVDAAEPRSMVPCSEAEHTLAPTVVVPIEPAANDATGASLTETSCDVSCDVSCEASCDVSQNKNPTAVVLQVEGRDLLFTCGDREYRVRGWQPNPAGTSLKVNLRVRRAALVHVDTLDLLKASARQGFLRTAATELFCDESLIKSDLGQLMLALERQLDSPTSTPAEQPPLSPADRDAALEFLRAPNLMERLAQDLSTAGMVGEQLNQMVGYLVAVSRKLPTPLAIVIQSSSSAGKTSLLEAILRWVPAEDQVRLSGLTGQALYYLPPGALQHKVLAVSEDEGLTAATYALKLLQSEGRLTQASVGKGQHGRMVTNQYTVEGPVAMMVTTTATQVDEELINRCLVLSVDESREQTRAILQHQRQARTLAARQVALANDARRTLHHNVQRLLEPLWVCNSLAVDLKFADHRPRLRRDHHKYLTLIDTIALLHQHQRPIRVTEIDGVTQRYIEVLPSDIELANRLTRSWLGRSLDELAPQARVFVKQVDQYVSEISRRDSIPRSAVRFTRRQLRQALKCADFAMRTHLATLVRLEYVLVHRGRNGLQYVYELMVDCACQRAMEIDPLASKEELTHRAGI